MARVLADGSTSAKGHFTAFSLELAPQHSPLSCTQCRCLWGNGGEGHGVCLTARADSDGLQQRGEAARPGLLMVPGDRASSAPGMEAVILLLHAALGSTKIACNGLSASPLNGVNSFCHF